MSEEEKEAIENYENDLKLAKKYGCFITKIKLADELLRVCKKQKEKIDKLQKENEEQNKTIEQLENTIVELSTAMEE